MASKRALRALGAGLGSISQSIMGIEEQKRKDAKEAEAVARDEAIRAEDRRRSDRDYEMRKNSAELANKAARQQMMLNEIKLNSQHISNAFAVSNGDPQTTVDAINQYGNVQRKLRFDGMDEDGNIKLTSGNWVKKPDDSGFEKNESGSMLFVPATDKDNRPVESMTMDRGTFNGMVMKTIKPDNQIALWLMKEQAAMGLETGKKQAQAESDIRVTEEGKTKKTALREAQIKKLEAEATAEATGKVKKDTEFVGIDGKTTAVTTAKVNSLTNDAKAYTGDFGVAVSAPQAHRLNQMSESDAAKKDVRSIAAVVEKGDFSKDRGVQAIVDEYDIPVGVAQLMIQSEIDSIERDTPGWWDKLTNSKKAQRAKERGL